MRMPAVSRFTLTMVVATILMGAWGIAPGWSAPFRPDRDIPAQITYPASGSGTYAYAAGRSAMVGRTGRLMRFRVAVEKGIVGVDPQQFATAALETLAAPQGWTAAGTWRFQQVGAADAYEFILYLATPATRDRLCAMGFDQYSSCRRGDRVVINVARWANGAVAFTGSLQEYRQYVINHEVGHRLGYGHELCPGAGRPAPVMQQQTLGLHGCTPNAWPSVRYPHT
jgi:hypothetical protein